MPEEIFTKTSLSRRFNLPESTVRFYCARFADRLTFSGEGRKARMLAAGLPVFAAIVEGMRAEKSARRVEALLAERFGPAPGKPTQPSESVEKESTLGEEAAALLRNQNRLLEALLASAESSRAAERTRTTAALATLDERLSRLAKRQDDAETLHREDAEQLRKWLSRLGKRLDDLSINK